jgi:hypothetical protein
MAAQAWPPRTIQQTTPCSHSRSSSMLTTMFHWTRRSGCTAQHAECTAQPSPRTVMMETVLCSLQKPFWSVSAPVSPQWHGIQECNSGCEGLWAHKKRCCVAHRPLHLCMGDTSYSKSTNSWVFARQGTTPRCFLHCIANHTCVSNAQPHSPACLKQPY